jgi:hypothetical protein
MPFDSHCQFSQSAVGPIRYITSHEYRAVGELMQWAQKTLIAPQPELRRSRKSKGESVCPFLYPSVEKGLCYISFGSGTPADAKAMQKEVESHVLQFDSLLPASASIKDYASLIIAFPDAGSSIAAAMDQVHDDLKGQLIRCGFMIARFHPECMIGSVWNRKLPVFCSPIAFFAIRYMALHDIYFLSENREFFLEYDKRFGHVFQQTRKLSSFYKPLIVAYRLTKARYEKAG